MKNTNGKLLQKNSLSLYHSINLSAIIEVLLLMGLGMLAIVIHARLRTPISIPGHQGLIFMAFLLAGRSLSKLPFASVLASIGAGLILLFPVLGFRDPFMGFSFLLPGLFLDIFYNIFPKQQKKLIFLTIIAGLAYMTVPVSRAIIHLFTGYPYGAFIKLGIPATIALWAAFGFCGGAAGSGISTIIKKFLAKKIK